MGILLRAISAEGQEGHILHCQIKTEIDRDNLLEMYKKCRVKRQANFFFLS